MGPPSVGKSSLLLEVLKGFPNSAYLDLRKLQSISEDSLEKLFDQSVDAWGAKMAVSLSGGLPFKAMNLKWKIKASVSKSGAGDEVSGQGRFLQSVESALEAFHKWSIVSGDIDKRPAVLVIDEANRLKDLYEVDQAFVTAFLSLLVTYSKQENRVSVVLATSDSFFREWLSQVGSVSDHFHTATLGDLPKEEATQFFVLEQEAQQQSVDLPFDQVFDAVGGRMISIRRYVANPKDFNDLPRVSTFFSRLSLLQKPSNHLAGRPRWSKKEFMTVVRAIVDSPLHAVPQSQLQDIVSQECLSDLVKFSVLCLRPDNILSRDLTGIEHPAYTFPFPEDVIGARKFLRGKK